MACTVNNALVQKPPPVTRKRTTALAHRQADFALRCLYIYQYIGVVVFKLNITHGHSVKYKCEINIL